MELVMIGLGSRQPEMTPCSKLSTWLKKNTAGIMRQL